MADYSAIKKAFQKRYQADLDVGIVLGFKGGMFSVADVVFDRDGKDVAIKIVREEDTIRSISQFFNECQSEGFYPLFLFNSFIIQTSSIYQYYPLPNSFGDLTQSTYFCL